ncbi:MAG: FMN-binding protein [Phycisphaeraceae bacterium]
MTYPPHHGLRGRFCALLLIVLLASPAFADSIESLSGTVIQGKIVSRDDKFVVMDVALGGKTVQRKYGLSLIRAIIIDGVREELKPGGNTPAPGPRLGPGVNPGPAGTRTKAEIDKLIAEAGRTPPDWFEDTPLNLPKSLDLAWPEKPPGGWNNQVNVGQFVWDVINPNDKRWREGIKFMQQMMDMHKNDNEKRQRAMSSMAGMYHHFFQDYARAAYWWLQAKDRTDWVGVAECYFRLGNKAMAMEIVMALRRRPSYPISLVKLVADMGETNLAIEMTADTIKAGSNAADEAMMHAGDACRLAGRFKQAQGYYEKIIAMPDDKNNKRSKDRARESLQGIKLFDTLDVKKVADGSYKASSLGYEGQVEIEVKVAGGRIDSLRVSNHKEKQYYAALTDTPAQIVAKQSVKGVDATSRATITSEAIINATAKALSGAMK